MSGDRRYSIVEYFDEHEGYRCGYCKSPDGNFSQGMWAHALTCGDYQDLIDRGWRRSGKYCYKPLLGVMCCPSYTVMCEAIEFRPTKSQKKVLKVFNRFLATGEKKTKSESSSDQVMQTPEPRQATVQSPTRLNLSTRPVPKKGMGPDPSKPRPVKAKSLRRERWKLKASGSSLQSAEFPSLSAGSSSLLAESSSLSAESPSLVGGTSSLRVESLSQSSESPSLSAGSSSQSEGSLKLTAGSSAEYTKKGGGFEKTLIDLISDGERLKDPKVKFELKLVRSHPPSEEFRSSFQESYQLYKKYQMKIHDDPPDKCTEKQYQRFLCDSPLISSDSGGEHPFGSYHQQYYFDDRLVAVGVVDILPACVSSVYLYYDPDFDFLTLGTLSALREIRFAQTLSSTIPSLRRYYMGFYIHSCPKMRYKGSYSPSFLLCPEKYRWHPIERCVQKLDATKYSRFEDEETAPANTFDGELDQVLVLHEGFPMNYGTYRAFRPDAGDEEEVRGYAEYVGKCAESMLLYRGKN